MERLKLQRRHTRATSPKGEQRVVQILEAARDIIIREGYVKLSMRKIAAACDMSVGNLVYYYPGKEPLVHDLCEAVTDGYLARFKELISDPDLSPTDRFLKTIEWLIKDLNTKETTHFFIDLWSQSNHDDMIKRSVNHIHETEQHLLLELMREINPEIAQKRLKTLALFMTATIEGHVLFLGHGRGHAASTAAIVELAAESFLDLVMYVPEKVHRRANRDPKVTKLRPRRVSNR